MSDTDPDVETVTEQILLSNRFAELVEEMASHYHDSDYKDKRLPELEATFAEEARDAGLSDDEAQTVADRMKGQLMGQAQQKAPPAPAERLPPGNGSIPEARYEELPGPLVRLLRLIEAEEKPFRQAHRLIDAVEWAVKWHTTLALSDLLSETDLPAEVKVLLAHGLRTPSLGLWNKFFRKSLEALEDPSLPWRSWERLTALEGEHNLVNFRNEYAHGATPPAEECREAVGTYLPVLKEMIHTPIFTDVGLAIRGEGAEPQLLRGSERQTLGIEIEEGHAAALLPDLDLNGEAPGETPWTERARLDLWPLGLTATASVEDADGSGKEERPQFFYFNALKNEAVERLNYEEALLDRAPGLYRPFHEQLPLRQWKKAEGPDLERFRARIETLTEDFVGRREERERLRTFATEGNGTLMVFGAPGIGKSALLAQVKREIEAGVDLDGRDLSEEMPPVIEYFIRSGESDDVTELLRHLCRRLDRRYGLSGHGLGSEPVELNEQLRARLQAIEDEAREEGESPERTLLLVDGLDEGPELGRYILESRSWLPVLVASRETEEARTFYENREIESREEMTVGPLSAADVRALLYKVISKYDPGLTEEYVQAVAERSEGNPLYLQLLAEQLFQGELEVGNIEALPSEVGTLYEETVQRVTDDGKNRMAEDVLLLLAEAQAPLSAGAMAGLLDERGSQVRSGLRAAMELLQRQDGGPEAPDRYQLFHETLREWLRAGDHAGDCAKINEQVAERCFAWTERRKDGARGYALRHAAAHLKATGRDDALYELLADEEYQEAQVRATGQFDATYRAYQHGLEAYVKRNGETPEDDARLCRLALDAGKVAREAKEGVTQAFRWAEDGRMDDALQRIEVLGEEKYFLAALRLLWIEADRQSERPEEERSSETAQKVLDAVEERIAPGTEAIDWSEFIHADFMAWWSGRVLTVLPDVDVTEVLSRTSEVKDLTESLIEEIQDLDGIPGALSQTARRSAEAISDTSDRADALSKVASALTEVGQSEQAENALDQAFNTVRTIEWAGYRARSLAILASALDRAGHTERAQATFDRVLETTESVDDDESLADITSTLADKGAFSRSLKIAQSISLPSHRAEALSRLASSLANTEHTQRAQETFREALETAHSINSPSKARALSTVAEDFAYHGREEQAAEVFEEALETARSAGLPFIRGEALSDIVEALTNANNLNWAFEVAQSIDQADDRFKAFSTVARAFAKTGAFERAVNIANSISGETQKARRKRVGVLSKIASALANDGLFDWALNIARKIEIGRYRAEAFSSVVGALFDNAAFERATEIAQSINRNEGRARVLSGLAKTLAGNGAFDQALDIAKSISTPIRTEALLNLTRALDESGHTRRAQVALEKVFDTAESINMESLRSQTLTDVASILSDTGAIRQALNAANSIKSNLKRAEILIELARTLDEKNAFDQALDAAKSIEYNPWRARTHTNLAVALHEAGYPQQAQSAFKEALEAAESTDSDLLLSRTLTNLASILAETGAFDRALDAAKLINSDSDRAKVLADLVGTFADFGAFDQARKIAQSIESGRYCTEALANLARARASAGHVKQARAVVTEALNIAESIESNSERAEVFTDLASVLNYADHIQHAQVTFDRALDTAQSIDSGLDRDKALIYLSRTLADTGTFDRALEIALSVDSSIRAGALANLVRTFADSGAFDQALTAAQSIELGTYCTEALANLARTLDGTGHTHRAREVVDHALDAAQSTHSASRDEALSNVVSALTVIGNFEQALDIAQSISQDSYRAEALTDLAENLDSTGRTQQARVVLDQAFDTAQLIEDILIRNQVLSDLVSSLADTHNFDRALDTAQSIESAPERTENLSDLARELDQTGHKEAKTTFNLALDDAQSIDSRADRDEVLASLALSLDDAGYLSFAIDVSNSIADLSVRVHTFEEIASQRVSEGREEEICRYFSVVKLDHDGWTDLLSTWREALLEHEEDPRPLLRQSLTLYPFDAEAAAEGVYALVQAHVQAGAMDHAEAIARECPELELDVLVQDSEPPIPEGCDPEMLSGFFEQQFEDLVESYKQGDLDDDTFKENAENIFKAADPE